MNAVLYHSLYKIELWFMKRILMILVLPWTLLHEVLHLLPIVVSAPNGTINIRMFWSAKHGFNTEVYKNGSNPFIMDVLSCIAPFAINLAAVILATYDLKACNYISAMYWYYVSAECGLSKQDIKQIKELWQMK